MRISHAVIAFSVAAIGAGCNDTDPSTGNLTTTAAACVIAENANRCTTTVSWTSMNARALSLQGSVAVVGPLPASGGTDVAVPVAGAVITLADEGKALATLTLAATCATETVPDAAGYCRPKPLRYTDKVYALYGYPRAVTSEGLTKVGNATRFATDKYSISACALKRSPEQSGRIDTVCSVSELVGGIASAASVRHKFYINPATESLHDGTDDLIVDTDYPLGNQLEIPLELSANYIETEFLNLFFQPVRGKYIVLDTNIFNYWDSVSSGYFLTEELRGSPYFLPRGSKVARPLPNDLEFVPCRTCRFSPYTIRAFSN